MTLATLVPDMPFSPMKGTGRRQDLLAAMVFPLSFGALHPPAFLNAFEPGGDELLQLGWWGGRFPYPQQDGPITGTGGVQTPQPMQRSASTTAISSTTVMAFTGQRSSQVPQPMHSSVFTYAT